MKNICKRISVVFLVVALALGIEVVKEGVNVEAATVGDAVDTPEKGWKRYDDNDSAISYSDKFDTFSYSHYYRGSHHTVECHKINNTQYMKFNFYGTKIRLIDTMWYNRTQKCTISIDGNIKENCSTYKDCDVCTDYNTIFYEKTGLNKGKHSVVIEIPEDAGHGYMCWCIDSIDIDSDGYLMPYSDFVAVSSLGLNKTEDKLKVGQVDLLLTKVAPYNANNKKLKWTSSNTDVATVDDYGKVTAIKDGAATITAETTDGSNLSAACKVTVTDPNKASVALSITLNNKDIKTYNISEKELDKFTIWYNLRSKGIGKSYYVFKSETEDGSIKEDYILYNQIAYFNVERAK